MASEWLTEDVVDHIFDQVDMPNEYATVRSALEVAAADPAFVDAVIRERVESLSSDDHYWGYPAITFGVYGIGMTVRVSDILAALGVTAGTEANDG